VIAIAVGRLTLNVLLSFAQFEREVTGERIHDKIAASKKKGRQAPRAEPDPRRRVRAEKRQPPVPSKNPSATAAPTRDR
jgi:DNA invertase Pin-like site-specific DNA recombinase